MNVMDYAGFDLNLLAPTPRAQDLIGPLRGALTTVSGALDLDRRFHPAESVQTFTLAVSEHPAPRVLPLLSAVVATEAPGIDLRVRGIQDRREAIRLLDEAEA
jgi:DNA-binding transcriptional LysR family regulator